MSVVDKEAISIKTAVGKGTLCERLEADYMWGTAGGGAFPIFMAIAL